ncbi:MAG TPA: 3-isopropylmalate dehydratase large subunit [Terriglobales bacterium]|nr:3-isopropylmalate dehydratase large subunit [Terriglobales bacterium]
MAQTLFDKVWERHVVSQQPGEPALLYVDLHLIHEVTSPQAFAGLRAAGRRLRRPDRTVATMDHDVPTDPRPFKILDEAAAEQLHALGENCRDFGVRLFDLDSEEQGIVHVIAPELGLTQPGMTIVCGDSHTSTHGAFGALAFGIGTSEVEHVFATQCLWQSKPQTLRLTVEGERRPGVSAKDIILHIIGTIGTAGATGSVIEYAGSAIRALSMEERMTVCNMSIEAGARAGMVAPDAVTLAYLRERRFAPRAGERDAEWLALASDASAQFDAERHFDAATIEPQVTWGTSPGMVAPVSGAVPDPRQMTDAAARAAAERALEYMGLRPGARFVDIAVDRVFIGSCTNARLSDLEGAAAIIRGRRVAPGVRAMVVPGSRSVRREAEARGLDEVFRQAGFEWREPGCSMCLGMNPDILQPGERCASTSNRNFEGRQGNLGRTHLVSPEMAAAAALAGHFTDVRQA